MPQPNHRIKTTGNFIEAMYDLADHGAITVRTTPRDILNTAEAFDESEADAYAIEARKLANATSNLFDGTIAEFGLRLSGKYSSGAPIFSISWTRLAEPSEQGEQAHPTQRLDCMTGLPLAEPTPEDEPLEPNPTPAPEHPCYDAAMIRRHLRPMSPGLRSELLTGLLATNLLDHAADNATSPQEFNQNIKDLLTEAIATLERKSGL